MRLDLESIDIKDIQVSSKTCCADHVLYVHLEELKDHILRDTRIQSVDIHLVYPGDRVRIVNLNDVIQPRCKLDKDNEDFPGSLGRLTIAGQGRTRSLRGITVLLSNPRTIRTYSPLLDMSGIGAEMSSYGSMKHLSVSPIPREGVSERDFENAVKRAGLRTAVYLARAAKGHPVSEREVYELYISPRADKPQLPKVAYYYQLHSPQHNYQGAPDPIFYGASVDHLFPTIIHPNEVLDGALVSTHSMRAIDTYSIQNHAIIKELYKRHQKELLFAGVVVGVANTDPVQRQRHALMAANLIANVLGADGVVLTKVKGGMPHVDLALVAEECEKSGVKTTLFLQLSHSSGSLTDAILFNAESLNALVNIGQTMERIRVPFEADRILGGTAETPIHNPAVKQKAGDTVIEIEEYMLAGVHDQLGSAKITAAQY